MNYFYSGKVGPQMSPLSVFQLRNFANESLVLLFLSNCQKFFDDVFFSFYLH